MQEFARRADLLDSLGDLDGPQYIHIAGTNGKGSVTAFLQSLLVESGYRTGAFFSPFVLSPRERVQMGRASIPEADLAELTSILKPIGESLAGTEFGGVTEFEFKTALGFLYWKRRRAEWVALEVGLGGRLDATNIVTPRASIIVSIGLDHTAILGETKAKIAFEKAGIIKAGVPVIVGNLGDEAMEVVISVATEMKAPLWRWNREVRTWPGEAVGKITVETPRHVYKDLRVGIPGTLQDHNLALAVAALDAAKVETTDEALRRGSSSASIPGRFQLVVYRGRRLILDGAHNADAAGVLRNSLVQAFPDAKVVLVTGMVSGHDPVSFYEPLAKIASKAYIVPIDFHRAVATADLAPQLSPIISSLPFESIQAGLEAAIQETETSDVIVVTGSFYLIGEVARLIGLS